MSSKAARRNGKRSSANTRYDEVVGPAVLTALHVRDRELSKTAGGPKAWRKMTVLQQAFFQSRLGACDSDKARERLSSGTLYTELWDRSQRPSRDSTQGIDAGGCVGSGAPLGEASRAALARLEAIEKHLGRNDRKILQCVCGWGHTIAEAMVAVDISKEQRASARFIETLDALSDAIDRTEKRGRR